MTKKILSLIAFVASVTACTEDYKDWADPQVVPQPTQVSFADGSVSAVDVIKFADIADGQATVKVCNITAPTATDEAYAPNYTIALGGQTYELAADGTMATSDLVSYVSGIYGVAPIQRDIEATVSAWLSNGTTAVKTATSAVFKVSVLPDAPFIDSDGYFLVGNIDGWKCVRVDEFHMANNGGDVYENPVFSITLPAVEGIDTYEIKMLPASAFNADGTIANWDIALSALPGSDEVSYEGQFSYSNAGGNIKFAADPEAKMYEIKADLMEGTYSVKPIAFKQFVYFIGATDGWATPDQKLETANFDGVYTGYIYCADPNGWGNDFKFQRTQGQWDDELNYSLFTSVTGDLAQGGGTNFTVTAGEGVYYVTLDLAAMTINAVKISNMNLVGDFNGWNPADDAQQMTWNATDFCYEISGAGVTTNGWKFTANNGWDINLGGTPDILVGNGPNISVAGATIKLYPTRKTSDKIYCTVE